MWDILIENDVKKGNELEENVTKSYLMVFKEFLPSQIKMELKSTPNIIVLLTAPLNLMDEIYQSMQGPIRET